MRRLSALLPGLLPDLFFGMFFGLLFGCGIALSGMINPAKVLNVFDIAGEWDPRLACVMARARAVARPDTRRIDIRLIAGPALCGIGWGIAGFCPGGALPAFGTLRPVPLAFIAALTLGIPIARGLTARASQRI